MTSYLLHAGIGKAGVRSRLILFSLAAPTGALLTYWLLSLNLFTYKQVRRRESRSRGAHGLRGCRWVCRELKFVLFSSLYCSCCYPCLLPLQESVALCLLFSGGTFLYVATAHVLPEITGCEL